MSETIRLEKLLTEDEIEIMHWAMRNVMFKKYEHLTDHIIFENLGLVLVNAPTKDEIINIILAPETRYSRKTIIKLLNFVNWNKVAAKRNCDLTYVLTRAKSQFQNNRIVKNWMINE
jgi:hypothetical protein